MFILTNNQYDERTIKGVFTTVEKAQAYTEKVMNHQDLKWSDPSHDIYGSIWANTGAGHVKIEPVEIDPTA
jgi:hypothetical protein